MKNDLEVLQNEHLELKKNHLELQAQYIYLQEQLAWLKRQVFGRKSEKIVKNLDEQQMSFEGFDVEAKPEPEAKEIAAHQRAKPNRKGQDAIKIPDDLPVETILLDLPEEEKICKETGKPLVQIGQEVSYKLAMQPGNYFIKEYIRPKYAHPDREEAGIIIFPMPDGIIPKCRADESLLADILVKKFADHLPLNRISEMYSRDGIGISRKLMSQWVLRCAKALTPLYDVMVKKVLEGDRLFIDETPVKVFDEEKCRQGYMWTMVGGEGADPPYCVYDFRETRQHRHVDDMLKGYTKILHSDKYGAYEKLAQSGQIIWCPCFAHIRRKFFEAETDPAFRTWILDKIGLLFKIEETAWTLTGSERLRMRQEQSTPLLDEIIATVKAKLTQGYVLPKSKLREALGYTCSLIPYLKNYLNHAEARLDNNPAERALRPLAVGRKNWLFFGSANGATAGAILFSLIQTCRHLKINPHIYLEDVMRRIMSHPVTHLHELLPDEWLLRRDREGLPSTWVS